MIFLEIAKNDLLQYQETLKNQVDLFFVYHSVDAEVRQLFPVTSNVFYKATIGNNTLHIVYRKNLYTMSHIMLSVSSGHTFTDDQLIEIFEAFLSKNPELKTQQSMIFKGAECVTAQFTTWIKERVKVGGSIKENPCVYYYMNSEQIELTKNHEFNLPDGYSFCDDISQEDALLINSTWKNAKPGDEIQTAARIKYLPFACIKKNSQPVSYVIYDSCGTLNHLYTDANHRQLGLGLAVELRASQKVIQLNRVPRNGYVDIDMSDVLEANDLSQQIVKRCCEEKDKLGKLFEGRYDGNIQKKTDDVSKSEMGKTITKHR